MKAKNPRFTVVSCLFLVAVTAAIYSPVRGYPFLNYDDPQYVTRNSHVQGGLTWKTSLWAWTATDAYNWHPLTWLSHALDCQLYGLNAGGHHLTSLLLHGLNVQLLFLLLLWATGSLGRSLLVAALFALHPLNVESVIWIAERKNLLSTVFFLLAIAAYGWYTMKPSIQRYFLLALLFGLGLASKPMVITLPFVLLLLDFWPLGRIQGWVPQPSPLPPMPKNRKAQLQGAGTAAWLSVSQASLPRLILEKLPLLALCLLSAMVTVIAQRHGGAVRSLQRIPLSLRIENATYSYAMYVWKAFWPVRLALYYPRNRLAFWKLGLAVLFLLVVSALAWKQRFTQRYLLLGWLWYLGTLVPVIGLIQVGDQAMADRYAYIPLIGIFVMAVWSLSDWADRVKISGLLRVSTAAIVLAILSFLTWRQQGYWRSSYDVWSHTLAVTGPNPLAESDLADALHTLGRPEEALAHFQNAVRMQSNDPVRHVDLAEDLAECGRLHDAIAEYETAIQLTSDPEKQARSYQSLAILHGELGEYSKVRESYHEALRINPQLGEDMIRNLSRAFAANPSGAGYLNLGMLLETAGRLSEARAAYQQALNLDPTLAEAKESLDALGRSNK
jgi:tetratricopeptide (TPR) repeat protein